MKTTAFALSAAALLLAAAGQAQIVVDGVVDAGYGPPLATDPALPEAGEGGPGAFTILDVTNLYAASDQTHLYVALEVAGDIAATDWGKYMITINSPGIAGTGSDIAWGRAVTVTSNFQILTWVDFGAGTAFYNWDGAAWQQNTAGESFVGNTSVPGVIEARVELAALGNPSSVELVAFSTGGGGTDPAMDMIPAENGNATSWTDPTVITFAATHVISTASVSDWTTFE